MSIDGGRELPRGAIPPAVSGIELAGRNSIDQQIDAAHKSITTNLGTLKEQGVFGREKATRPWPLNVATAESKTGEVGEITIEWEDDQDKSLRCLTLWPVEHGSSLSWESQPGLMIPESQFSEEDVKRLGALIYVGGRMVETKYTPKVLTESDLPKLKEIAEEQRRLIAAKPDRSTECSRRLDHLLLLIGEIEDSDSHSVVEAVSQRTEKSAVLAEIEATRAWQDMKRIEASLAQAASQPQEVLGEGE